MSGTKDERNLPAPVAGLLADCESAFAEAVTNLCTGEAADDPLYALEGFRQAVRLANAGHLMHLEADPANPLLIKMQSLQRQMMSPSADAVYHQARLHGDYSYRLTGNRGSAYLFQIAVYRGSSAYYPNFEPSCLRDNLEGTTLAAGNDLDLVFDASPRPELGDRWLPLPDGECELHIRQYYYDWQAEEPARLVLEREGGGHPPPPLGADAIAERVGHMNSWLRVQSTLGQRYVQSMLQADPEFLKGVDIPGAFEGTCYINGHYRCAPDEAVIMEGEVPDAVYWGFQLSNLGWEGLDYYQRQTSLNGAQAVIDDDGRFRAVISHRDPGVANWLDAGGRKLGIINGRAFRVAATPEFRLTTVPLERVLDHLPETTVRVSGPERTRSLRDRWASVHRRLCSDQ